MTHSDNHHGVTFVPLIGEAHSLKQRGNELLEQDAIDQAISTYEQGRLILERIMLGQSASVSSMPFTISTTGTTTMITPGFFNNNTKNPTTNVVEQQQQSYTTTPLSLLTDILSNMALAHYLRHNYVAGIQTCEHILRLDESHMRANYYAGMMYKDQNNRAMAKKYFQSALICTPLNHPARVDVVRELASVVSYKPKNRHPQSASISPRDYPAVQLSNQLNVSIAVQEEGEHQETNYEMQRAILAMIEAERKEKESAIEMKRMQEFYEEERRRQESNRHEEEGSLYLDEDEVVYEDDEDDHSNQRDEEVGDEINGENYDMTM